MSDSISGESPSVSGSIRTRWLGLGLLLGLALIGAGCYHYWVKWCEHRSEGFYRSRAYSKLQGDFITNIKQGRIDAAYDATTPAFQRRVSRDEFQKLAQACMEFHSRPDARSVGGTPRGPIERGYQAKQVVTQSYRLQDAEGNQIDVMTTVLIEDSIFYLHPPTPRVDDFFVKRNPP